MNDAERDAWLREALRHAPDSDALPPSGVSEAILQKARAAARGTRSSSRHGAARGARANPFVALWHWLARPPVAAGFASVMAATLVGLMWWDRPMDETMPRPSSTASDRAAMAPLSATAPAPAPPSATERAAVATPDATRATPAEAATSIVSEATNDALLQDRAALRQRSAGERAGAADVRRAESAPPYARRENVEVARSRAYEDAGRVAADERRPSTADSSAAAKAKSAAETTPPTAGAARDVPATPGSAAPPVASPAPLGAAAPAPAPFLGEAERARPDALMQRAAPARPEGALRADAVTRAAPVRVFAAIAAEPERWQRQTASGDAVALDAGWRGWLADLDAAAAGRWQLSDTAVAPAEATARDGATALRLVSGGRVAAIVRLDGATVQVDASPGTGGDRWQAALPAAAAERLRSSARRLSP